MSISFCFDVNLIPMNNIYIYIYAIVCEILKTNLGFVNVILGCPSGDNDV